VIKQIINPEFEIDDVGRVVCKNHSNYQILRETPLSFDIIHMIIRDKKLTCKTCSHFRNDNCFFPKSEIIKIVKDKGFFHRKFKCDVCKSRISQLFNILFKLSIEDPPNLRISLLCCECYQSLKISDNSESKYNATQFYLFFLFIYCTLFIGLPILFYGLIPWLKSLILTFYLQIFIFFIGYYLIRGLLRNYKRQKFIEKIKVKG